VFLDLFASFALGALGFNHPALVPRRGATPSAVRASADVDAVRDRVRMEFDSSMELETKWAPRG